VEETGKVSLAKLNDLVSPITRDGKFDDNLRKIQKYNRRLERFLGMTYVSATGISTNKSMKKRPSYEVRQVLTRLHEILAESWTTCNKSHHAKLQLATLEGSNASEDAVMRESDFLSFGLLFGRHTGETQWRQSKMEVHR
jgi:hypothetical protein